MLIDALDERQGERPLSGALVFIRVLENMEQNAVEMWDHIVLPSRFEVHCNPEDEEVVKSLAPLLREQFYKAADERIRQLNADGGWRRWLAPKKTKPFRRRGPWQLSFYSDPDGRIERGQLEVIASLDGSEGQSIDEGKVTLNAGQLPPDEAGTVLEGDFSDVAEVAPEPVCHAEIDYEDSHGKQSYRMVEPEIAVGRGGRAYFTDVTVVTSLDMSREHFRLRVAACGGLEILDVSKGKTYLDGTPLKPNTWTLLPARATVRAGKVDFAVQTRRTA